MVRIYLILLLITMWYSLHPVAAMAQQLDPGFAPTLGTSPGGRVQAMATQPDGKVIVMGQFQSVSGQPAGLLLRLRADGSPDLSFRPPVFSYNASSAFALAVQPDGKILVGSLIGSIFYNGIEGPTLVRLNADGSLDASFIATQTTGELRCVAVQADGKILVGGTKLNFNGQPTQALMRLLASGAPDPTFQIGSGFTDPYGATVWKILVQPDGKIVAGGKFTSLNGRASNAVARLNADGSPDLTFTSPLAEQAYVYALARQPLDGKLLVGGTTISTSSAGPLQTLLRLLPTGVVDASFTTYEAGYGNVFDVRVLTDGRLLVGGTELGLGSAPRASVARFASNGQLEGAFTDANRLMVFSLIPLPSGSYLAGGHVNNSNVPGPDGLLRLTAAGELDAGYNLDLSFLSSFYQLYALPNGKLIAQSNGFSVFNGQPVPFASFRQLNADGTYERPASLPIIGPFGTTQVFPRPDGTFYFSLPINGGKKVSHLLADGTTDPAFTPLTLEWPAPQGPNSRVTLLVLPDGKFLIGGEFVKLNGQPSQGLTRVLPNGAPDASFGLPTTVPWQQSPFPNSSNFNGIEQVQRQPDGRLLVLWRDPNRSYLTRLQANGSLDNSFALGSAAGATTHFGALVLADGKVLVNGKFNSFSGQAAPNGLVRLLADGQPDPTFTAASAVLPLNEIDFASLSLGLLEQPDGRLLLLAPGTNPLNAQLRRLLPDGRLDASFQPLIVTNETGQPLRITSLQLQPSDHKILLAGSFTSVAGQPRYGLARLSNTTLAARLSSTAPGLEVFPNPAHHQLRLRVAGRVTGPVLLTDMRGRAVRSWSNAQAATELPLVGLAPGVYVLQAPTALGTARQRVVIAE